MAVRENFPAEALIVVVKRIKVLNLPWLAKMIFRISIDPERDGFPEDMGGVYYYNTSTSAYSAFGLAQNVEIRLRANVSTYNWKRGEGSLPHPGFEEELAPEQFMEELRRHGFGRDPHSATVTLILPFKDQEAVLRSQRSTPAKP